MAFDDEVLIDENEENTLTYLEGDEVNTNSIPYSQVYAATHDGSGNPLPVVSKTLISFSWGGINIEDFSLLVVNDGDSYNGSMYTNFKDLVTEYDIVDGQQYWGTTFSANTVDFQLATDGITEKKLQDFKAWFKPGIERELILAEHPNRGISARLSVSPQYSLLPFKKEEEVKVGSTVLGITRTTLWKGTITLNFVMDEPFWHNITGLFTTDNLSEEELKSIVEDGVPHKSMFKVDCFTANGYFNYSNSSLSNSMVELDNDTNKRYLYYCGTAKEAPIYKINFKIDFDENNKYIVNPKNSYAVVENGEKYSNIYLKKNNKIISKFSYTLPGLLLSYNQAISIIDKFNVGDSIVELKTAFRDEISNFIIKSNIMGICDLAIKGTIKNVCTEESALTEGWKDIIINRLKLIFKEKEVDSKIWCYCEFNSKTGKAIAKMYINPLNLEIQDEVNESIVNEEIFITENVGDMIRSDYLFLEEQTLPNGNNEINAENCIEITADDNVEFGIEYKYKYL
jgi:hypothetical protein